MTGNTVEETSIQVLDEKLEHMNLFKYLEVKVHNRCD